MQLLDNTAVEQWEVTGPFSRQTLRRLANPPHMKGEVFLLVDKLWED